MAVVAVWKTALCANWLLSPSKSLSYLYLYLYLYGLFFLGLFPEVPVNVLDLSLTFLQNKSYAPDKAEA